MDFEVINLRQLSQPPATFICLSRRGPLYSIEKVQFVIFSEDIVDVVTEQLEEARRKLLDLSRRNQMLNFRPSSKRAIWILDELPAEIYQSLVMVQCVMECAPLEKAAALRKKRTADRERKSDQERPFSQTEAFADEWPVSSVDIGPQHTDRYLQTELNVDTLFKTLNSIHKTTRMFIEEQGYNTLHLALGFVSWSDPKDSSAKISQAPLLLIPLEITRHNIKKSFALAWNGQDILTNVALQMRLADMRIELPDFDMPEDKDGINTYFDKVAHAIREQKGWKLVKDMFIGFFSFKKFVMYHDLKPEGWPKGRSPEDAPLMRDLLDPLPVAFQEQDDSVQAPSNLSEMYNVMDIDPSQQQVVDVVKTGENLVVEGPPGTGKSQTITNLIAELLAAGKSVLFVAEKMAALEVVKSRLERVGLGDYCLELHGRKSSPATMIQALRQTMALKSPGQGVDKDVLDELDRLRRALNDYVDAMLKPVGLSRRSPSELLDACERSRALFAEQGRTLPNMALHNPGQVKAEELARTEQVLAEIRDILEAVAPVTRNAWYGTQVGVLSPDQVRELETRLDEILDGLRAMRDETIACLRLHGQAPDTDPDNLSIQAAAALVRDGALPVAEPVAVDLDADLDRTLSDAERWIADCRRMEVLKTEMDASFTPEAFQHDMVPLLKAHLRFAFGWLRFFKFLSPNNRKAEQRLPGLMRGERPEDDAAYRSMIEKLLQVLQLRYRFEKYGDLGKRLFGECWKAVDSTSAELDQAFQTARRLTERMRALAAAIRTVQLTVKPDHAVLSQGRALGQIPCATLRERLQTWRDAMHQVHAWGRFVQSLEKLSSSPASFMLSPIQNGELSADELASCFEYCVAHSLLEYTFRQQRALLEFSGELHQKMIDRFAVCDRSQADINRNRLLDRLHDRRPRLYEGASPQSEAGILIKAFNRKARHWPIRKILSYAGPLVQRIRPCFMMSPLSVSQFLDPLGELKFDVVIVDEASQVRLEDALSTLIRGRQLVVMGDTRQLPPTSFFEKTAGEETPEDDEWESALSDIESLLHQCKRTFQMRELLWHYRSRHHSLIAVSNRAFYNDHLRVCPSPYGCSEERGLTFRHLRDMLYEGYGLNTGEAEAVANAAIEHARRCPHKSLGIGTFGMRQQQAIENALEQKLEAILAEHPDEALAAFFHERRSTEDGFFIKNLETIQGDERDVILISVGYGFNDERKLSMNFGPLNQQGGERRLNVLISRSRERCVVFSNFKASDMRVDKGSPEGVRALQLFLEVAETGALAERESAADQTGGAAVAVRRTLRNALEQAGYAVDEDIGCAAFAVSMGVKRSPNDCDYLLGILLDEPRYLNIESARARDRLRDQLLARLGWKLHKIWRLDFHRRREPVIEQMLDAMRKAEQGALSAPESAPAPVAQPVESARVLDVEDYAPDHPAATGMVVEYQACKKLRTGKPDDPGEAEPAVMARAVAEVVAVEAPIHEEVCIQRLKQLWRIPRLTEKIRNNLSSAIKIAEAKNLLRQRGDFLWKTTEEPVQPRMRTGKYAMPLDHICDQEILAATDCVLRLQFGTERDALVRQSAKLLGDKRLSDTERDRIRGLIDLRLEAGVLIERPNGMVCLVNENDEHNI